MAKTVDDDIEKLYKILHALRRQTVYRTVVAWERSSETFDEEIISLNDIDEAIRNNRG